jgi:hypothetical protein
VQATGTTASNALLTLTEEAAMLGTDTKPKFAKVTLGDLQVAIFIPFLL